MERESTRRGRSKVLLVDDSRELLAAYTVVLESTTSHEIRSTTSGRAALDIVKAWHPDLVVTDVMMPDVNGLDLITLIRSEVPPPLPAILAVSGFPDFEREARHRGAQAFHAKPIDPDDLAALIESLLANRPPPADVRERTRVRRQATSEQARAAVATTLARRPYFAMAAQLGARLFSRYFEDAQTAVLLMGDERLTVFATSSDRWPAGTQPDGVVGYVLDVVESGSTLIVPDLTAMPAAASREPGTDWRLLVAVPLRTAEGIAIGALALAAPHPIPFDVQDLAILESLAGRLGKVFSGDDGARLMHGPGVLSAEAWRHGLACEAAHLAYGHSLVLALGALPAGPAPVIPLKSDVEVEAWRRDMGSLIDRLPPRTAVGRLTPETLAAYSLVDDAESGARSLLALLASFEEQSRACVAVLSVSGLVPTDSGAAFLDITRWLLDSATAQGPGTAVTAHLGPVAVPREVMHR